MVSFLSIYNFDIEKKPVNVLTFRSACFCCPWSAVSSGLWTPLAWCTCSIYPNLSASRAHTTALPIPCLVWASLHLLPWVNRDKVKKLIFPNDFAFVWVERKPVCLSRSIAMAPRGLLWSRTKWNIITWPALLRSGRMTTEEEEEEETMDQPWSTLSCLHSPLVL